MSDWSRFYQFYILSHKNESEKVYPSETIWEQRRHEIARDLYTNPSTNLNEKESVICADKLIKALKGETK